MPGLTAFATRFLCSGMCETLEGWQGLDGFAGLLLGKPDLVKALQIQPEFRRRAKEMGEAQGRVAGDGAPSIQALGDAVGGNIQLPRQFGGAHAQLFQLFRQLFTRVNCNYCHGVSPSKKQVPQSRSVASLPRAPSG